MKRGVQIELCGATARVHGWGKMDGLFGRQGQHGRHVQNDAACSTRICQNLGIRIFCSLLVAALPFGGALADAPKEKNAKVTLVYQHEPPNVPGKSIKGVLVEYGLGGYSPAHMHPKSAFIYATGLEGAIRSQVNDGTVTVYEAGQSFSEPPGDRHSVSANTRETKPAKLLALVVVDTNETELMIPLAN
jgi:quercetin dioxygenase-like cupin family protein